MLREGAGTGREPEGVAQPELDWLADPAHDRLPTNAVRGLAGVLIKLIRDERPSHMGVAFDLAGRVHRDDHYDRFVKEHPDYAPGLVGYKGTRPETPVEIHAQFPLARLVCARALGIPVLGAQVPATSFQAFSEIAKARIEGLRDQYLVETAFMHGRGAV